MDCPSFANHRSIGLHEAKLKALVTVIEIGCIYKQQNKLLLCQGMTQ
jgi:hypothetical protein